MILNYLYIVVNNINQFILLIINFYKFKYTSKKNIFIKNNNHNIDIEKDKNKLNKEYNIEILICNLCRREIKYIIYNLHDNHYCSDICRKKKLKNLIK